MRIISGQAGGVTLLSPKDPAVRPTTDRVKESVFGSLGSLAGLVVVDLFSGAGSLGLEAYSRGAALVCMVEKNPQNCRLIRRNLERVRKAMPSPGEARVMAGDVLRTPQLCAGVTPDVILADPPYAPGRGAMDGTALLDHAGIRRWAGDEALLVLEQSQHALPEPVAGLWRLERRRRYGSTVVDCYRPAEGAGRAAAK